VLNVNVPNMAAHAIRGVKLTQPGVSCTQPNWKPYTLHPKP